MYQDKTLVCKECGQEFVFSVGEQEFYAERGFQNEPQRCKACRDARKNSARGPREFFTATCARCGGEAKVPCAISGKSSAVSDGSFAPSLLFGKLEIHPVFRRFPNIDLWQNPPSATLDDLPSVA